MSRPGAARQLVLDFAHAPSYAAEDFLVSPANAAAHATLAAWPDWPARTLMLVGPPGSGKSHLAAIWAASAGAAPIAPDTLGAPAGPLLGLIDDADRRARPEAALFHLLNMIEETEGWLLLTAQNPPDHWGVRTPDLLSRLRRAPVARIETPDAALLRAVMVKLFADRQICIEPDVVAYAALNCDQSLDAIARFVVAVDEAALAQGRRITRPLAARTLSALEMRS